MIVPRTRVIVVEFPVQASQSPVVGTMLAAVVKTLLMSAFVRPPDAGMELPVARVIPRVAVIVIMGKCREGR